MGNTGNILLHMENGAGSRSKGDLVETAAPSGEVAVVRVSPALCLARSARAAGCSLRPSGARALGSGLLEIRISPTGGRLNFRMRKAA